MNIQSAKATIGESTSQHEIKMFYEQRSSEAWYPSHGLLTMKETVQIVNLILVLQKTDFWDPTFFHHI